MKLWQAAVKRLIDVVLGAFALVVLIPVMALVAVAVAVDSTGPVVYGARRVGRHGREFTMWKFRSMARGADRVGPAVTGAYDFRVTRVGAFLRRTKLDELPQLVNVLAGQMSLVGPRPESPVYVERWTTEEREILAFRPGITGPTQIAYIDEEERLAGDPNAVYESELMHVKLAVDRDYVRRFSLRGDLGIMWKTLVGILSAGERSTNRPRRRYTVGERLGSARLGPILLDTFLAAIAAALAVGLRIDRNNIFAAVATYWIFIPLAAIVRPAGFLIAGAYMRVWRYPTVSDAALIVSSLAAGSLIMTILIFVVMQPWAFPGSVGFPRSAIIIEFLLSFIVLGGIRFASRIRQEGIEEGMAPASAGPPRPVLIYGAGEAGALLVREMRRNRSLRLEPVAFLDDDPAKRGQRIYGVEVVGGAKDLPLVAAEREVAEVIVAMPRIGGDLLRQIVALSEAAGVAVRTLPAVDELLDETVSVNRVRPVRVEDLLRREPIAIPEGPMRSLVEGRTVLVTGAGGSIGSELCRQIASLGARRIVLFERAETPLFYVDEETRRRFPGVEVVAVVGDVTDEGSVSRCFEREQPQVVFHAAAQKHVPLSEANVAATVWTNVRGTRLVAQAAVDIGVEAFIFISTDKAVDPSSIMGATKRIGEELVRTAGASAAGRFVVVRFGNVMGSQGSVLELFRQQIADGGPVTITHPDMTRYFMTIPEAVRLILHAGAVGRPGDIHVLNMGQPIRIVDLASDLIRLSSPAGSRDIAIVFTGLRPGEKLEETLFGTDEEALETDSPFLLVARLGDEGPLGSTNPLAAHLEALAGEGRDAELRDQLGATAATSAARG
ncbi:MAG: SDR family NAD(P)-dependent oxidoreductase [Rhizobiales bacterium]|nr:SDR family NAD(P)-dependent oxidoreductase [Hyphomicrobiales bacterium]